METYEGYPLNADYNMAIADAVTDGANNAGAYAKLREAIATLNGESGKAAQEKLTLELAALDSELSDGVDLQTLSDERMTVIRSSLLEILEITADIIPES